MPSPHGTILVVDDQAANRQLLSRVLCRRGYDVAEADDGASALRLVEERPFSLVLLDIMMPVLDGMEVLRRLRREHSATDLPVIMVTAKDQTEDVVEALGLGANDYVTKPLDLAVVVARVSTQMSLHAANAALAAAHDRMERDLAAAARIQQALLPAAPPDVPGVAFAWRVTPCDELAGDGLGISTLGEGIAGLHLVDVSGHGVAAALLSVSLAHMLAPVRGNPLLFAPGEANGARPRSPVEVVERLNDRFQIDVDTSQYFTLVYALLDVRAGLLRYVCAGHPGPVHVTPGAVTPLEPQGFPVGWSSAPDYHEHRLALAPGDRVYFYSDGLVDARSASGEVFGVERLCTVIDAARGEPLSASVDRLDASVTQWAGASLADDVSILCLEVAARDRASGQEPP